MIKILFALILLPLFMNTQFARAQEGGDRGGGDGFAIEFAKYESAILEDLKPFENTKIFKHFSYQALVTGQKSFTISSTSLKRKMLDSRHIRRAAITDQKAHEIILFSPDWNAMIEKPFVKVTLVIHELLRAAGLGEEDEVYALAEQIFKTVYAGQWSTSHAAQVDRWYSSQKMLASILQNKKLVCQNQEKTKNMLEVQTITDEVGATEVQILILNSIHSTSQSPSFLASSKTYTDASINQISVGQNIFISWGEKVTSYQNWLTLRSPHAGENCQDGIFNDENSFADILGDEGKIRAKIVRCCLQSL